MLRFRILNSLYPVSKKCQGNYKAKMTCPIALIFAEPRDICVVVWEIKRTWAREHVGTELRVLSKTVLIDFKSFFDGEINEPTNDRLCRSSRTIKLFCFHTCNKYVC